MWNGSFEKYDSNFKREDNSIWKPIKNRRKPKTSSPIRKYSAPPGPRAKMTRKKLNYLQNIFTKFSPHIIIIKIRNWNKEVEKDLATPIQSQERLKAFTLKE